MTLKPQFEKKYIKSLNHLLSWGLNGMRSVPAARQCQLSCRMLKEWETHPLTLTVNHKRVGLEQKVLQTNFGFYSVKMKDFVKGRDLISVQQQWTPAVAVSEWIWNRYFHSLTSRLLCSRRTQNCLCCLYLCSRESGWSFHFSYIFLAEGAVITHCTKSIQRHQFYGQKICRINGSLLVAQNKVYKTKTLCFLFNHPT